MSVPRVTHGLLGDWDASADRGCPVLTFAAASFDSLTLIVCNQRGRPENSLFPCPALSLRPDRNVL